MGTPGKDGTNGTNGAPGTNGTNGKDGVQGPPGPAGDAGPPGPAGCDGQNAGDSARLSLQVTVAAPPSGSFYKAGDSVVITINLVDRCNRPVSVASLATLNLYLSGPRAPLSTQAATKLLNCIVDRAAPDRQHHMINLLAPKFLDGAQKNLVTTSTGWQFTTAPITNEAPGTYTVGVWAVSKDLLDQQLPTVDLQIGTATPETYASGAGGDSTCYTCHLGTLSGKSYQAHITPGFSPEGNYALDQTPIANCKLCHNTNGYSANPIISKVHGAHRGSNLLNPGAGHPEYGLPADGTIAAFTNVSFPVFAPPAISPPTPGNTNSERDCVKCHTTDSYLKNPSRMACGTCHDNLFFDTGLLTPPRNFGKPYTGVQYAAGTAKACVADADCAGFGQLTSCDVMSGMCLRKSHPKATDDSQCATCHSADNSGLSPIAARHDVQSRNAALLDGLVLSNVVISGQSGGVDPQHLTYFKAGDVPVIKFQLKNGNGPVTALTDAKDPNYANWSANVILTGPNDNPQRIWATATSAINVKTAKLGNGSPALVYDANSATYTFTFPNPTGEVAPGWPAKAMLPADSPLSVPQSARQVNQPGTYTVWFYIYETLRPAPPNIRNISWRATVNQIIEVRFGADGPIQPRDVVTKAACDSCHTITQAHGGSRTLANACFVCHTPFAEDAGVVGSLGAKCTLASQATDCSGFANGTQACQDTNNDGIPDTCVVIKDPTPNEYVDFRVMVHQIHFARKLEGYNQRNNIPYAGKLQINNADFSDILFPQDVRNCTKCHGDTAAVCSAKAPCGYGQSCVGGKCRNTAYKTASAQVCASCHDSAPAYAHFAIMTTVLDGQPVESCDVCHGEGAEFEVTKVHNISNPYVPPYSRE